jgi:hypothetical protein
MDVHVRASPPVSPLEKDKTIKTMQTRKWKTNRGIDGAASEGLETKGRRPPQRERNSEDMSRTKV